MPAAAKRNAQKAFEEGGEDIATKDDLPTRASKAWLLVSKLRTPVARKITSERDLSITDLSECYRIFVLAIENDPKLPGYRATIPITSEDWKEIFSERCTDHPPPVTTAPILGTGDRIILHGDIPVGSVSKWCHLIPLIAASF